MNDAEKEALAFFQSVEFQRFFLLTTKVMVILSTLERKHAKVIYWTSRGYNYKEIASKVSPFKEEGISEKTIQNYMWQVKKAFNKDYSSRPGQLVVHHTLDMWLRGNPENLDGAWPPLPIDWIPCIIVLGTAFKKMIIDNYSDPGADSVIDSMFNISYRTLI